MNFFFNISMSSFIPLSCFLSLPFSFRSMDYTYVPRVCSFRFFLVSFLSSIRSILLSLYFLKIIFLDAFSFFSLHDVPFSSSSLFIYEDVIMVFFSPSPSYFCLFFFRLELFLQLLITFIWSNDLKKEIVFFFVRLIEVGLGFVECVRYL